MSCSIEIRQWSKWFHLLNSILFVTSVCFHGVIARNHFEIMHASRLDIFLSEFDDIRVAATRSRQDCVCNGVALPAVHNRGQSLRHGYICKLSILLLNWWYYFNHIATFFQDFSEFWKKHSRCLWVEKIYFICITVVTNTNKMVHCGPVDNANISPEWSLLYFLGARNLPI